MRIARVAFLSVILPSVAVASTPREEVAVAVRSSGAVKVPVVINGQGPFTFVLDTGSSHTTVSTTLVDRLSLPAVGRVRVTTAAGVQMRLVVRLEHMAIGDASREGLLPSALPATDLHAMERGIDGVVGQDFLSAFDYTLDYRRKRLSWSVGPEDGNVRLPLVRAGDRSLVQLAGNGRGGPVLMVPDTGAEGLVFFERDGKTAVAVDDTEHLAAVSSLAAQRLGRVGRMRELKVGAITLRDEPAVIIPAFGSNEVEGDGLMPLHGFTTVRVNNREGYMVITR